MQAGEQYVYLATLLCSVTALVLTTAPAAQHRLQRPLRDREQFKNNATRLSIIGLVPLSAAALIVLVWWHHPLRGQADQRR